MPKNLVIVESPAKAKTIEGFLGKDFTVKSSFGHVRDLAKKDLGIDIENGFKPLYTVSSDKTKVVQELKKAAKEAEMVWLASDEDREGEAIAWHLFEALKLKEEKTKRIVFHEITKDAITEAIENPRGIDVNLVNAQQARRVLDRLVGFELSPLLWKKVKPALSAGRVQSVAVKLIVEREDEIKNFKSVSSFRVIALFLDPESDKEIVIKAELPHRFEKKEDAQAFLEDCVNASFTVNAVEKKPAKRSPAPPFTTSTLQQEASRKLGFSVAKTMMVAQQLYESGKITYMRTDSVNLSKLAISMAKEEITNLYGKEYSKTRRYTTKAKGAQEAHEAIRPTYLTNSEVEGDASQKRLYSLIWKRTIASQMSDAQFERTTVDIDVSTSKHNFVAKGEVITFDGFLKVYSESTDEEPTNGVGGLLPPMKQGQLLNRKEITATERFSQSPARYTEASLVKKMEELGIGRPSTYAPTISTIQKREYVVKEDRDGTTRKYSELKLSDNKIKESEKSEKTGYEKSKLFPTDLGGVVNKFLLTYFDHIIDYNFTADVEKEFDSIASGKKEWNAMLDNFYGDFHKLIQDTQENTKKFSGERLLGEDPKTGKNIFVKIGRFGPMAQLGDTESEEKPKFAGLRKEQSLETITLEEAIALFDFPRTIGEYEGEELTVAIGRFGPYVKHKGKFFSIPKGEEPGVIGAERAVELIEAKREADKKKTIKEFPEKEGLLVLNGRYGPYISFEKKNYKIPKSIVPEEITLEQCEEIINKTPKSGSSKRTTKGKKK